MRQSWRLTAVLLLIGGRAWAQHDAPPQPTLPDGTPVVAPAGVTLSTPAELKFGDPAPALVVEKFLKGEPVTEFKPGHVYVLDFWQLGNIPALRAFPELSAIQAEHKDHVTVIGIDVAERYRDNTLERVQALVDRQGDKMAYTVAYDGKAGAADKAFLQAAKRITLLPTTVVVGKDGKIAAVGHSMFLRDILPKIIAGTWTETDAATMRETERELATRFDTLLAKNDGKGIVAFIDSVAKHFPKLATQFEDLKAQGYLIEKDYDNAYPILSKMVDHAIEAKDPQNLNQIAWTIVDPQGTVEKKDLELAFRASTASLVIDGRKEAAFIDTLARIQFLRGDLDEAIALQTEAVLKAPQARKAELEGALKEYRDAKEKK